MSLRRILAISASPSEFSKTAQVVDLAAALLAAHDFTTKQVQLRTARLESMLSYPVTDPALRQINDDLEMADGVIIATPIYKASYSGLLKLYLDQLPQFALAGKAILPLATGGTLAHVLALDYALRPVLQSMGARHIIQSHFVLAADIVAGEGEIALRQEVSGSFVEAVHHFRCSVDSSTGDPWLGHPRPERQVSPA